MATQSHRKFMTHEESEALPREGKITMLLGEDHPLGRGGERRSHAMTDLACRISKAKRMRKSIPVLYEPSTRLPGSVALPSRKRRVVPGSKHLAAGGIHKDGLPTILSLMRGHDEATLDLNGPDGIVRQRFRGEGELAVERPW